MPNLVITNTCNLRCEFCFASEYRVDPAADTAKWMSLETFRHQLEFSGVDSVRLCGGEPTLHPEFLAMLDIALADRRRSVFIMTNGLWPESIAGHVASLPRQQARRVTYLVNVLEPSCYTDQQDARLTSTLRALPPKSVTLGLTIDRADVHCAHVLKRARRHGIERIRYSVAAPNVSDPRSWAVDPERDFKAIANAVFALYRQARDEGIAVHSDCGYLPPCAFEEAQLQELLADDRTCAGLDFGCSGPIDIGPDGEAWRCYGLYAVTRTHSGDYQNSAALASDLERRTQTLEELPLFEACRGCALLERQLCGGGCYAFRVARSLRARATASGVEVDDREALLRAVARVERSRLRMWKRGGSEIAMVSRSGEWHELPLSELERDILQACDGQRSVAGLIASLRASHREPALEEQVCMAVRRLFEQNALELRARQG